MEKKSPGLAIATFILSVVCLLLLGYILYNSSFNSRLLKIDSSKLPSGNKGTIKIDDAVTMVDVYRNSVAFYNKTYLAWHNQDQLNRYFDVFNKCTTSDASHHNYIAPPMGYEWRIGFSPMFVQDDKKDARLTVCILPTLVNPTLGKEKDVYDFFDEKNSGSNIFTNYFDKLNTAFIEESKNSPGPFFISFIYDEGNLWP